MNLLREKQRAQGHMPMVAAAVIGSAVIGGAVSSSASKSAAKGQAQSAADATAAQERMFERQVELQQPWMDAGKGGLSELNRLLGISSSSGPSNPYTLNDFIGYNNRIAPNQSVDGQISDANDQFRLYQAGSYGADQNAIAQRFGFDPGRVAQAQAEAERAKTAQQNDPAFGSLLKEFGAADFQADPGYAFRQEEQERALQRAASSNGGIGSGKYLKDAMKYSGGLASQEYGAAFDRFNVGKTNTFNRLASLSGIGQTAANQTGAAAGNFGAQIGSNIIGAGNALAAGRVGSSNAINNGLGQVSSMYQTQNMMDRFFPKGGSSGGGSAGGYGYGGPMDSSAYGYDGSNGAYWN